MRSSKSIIAQLALLQFVITSLFPAIALAWTIVEVSSTMNPVGSGSRATGMGGAFIGVADDATAASWNPAGLIHLERPEFSLVYSTFRRTQAYDSTSHPEVDSTHAMDTEGVNFASFAYPFLLCKKNMVVSLNYQRLYELSKRGSIRYTRDIDGMQQEDQIEFQQSGYLYALSPAMSVRLLPTLALGATLNLWSNYVGTNGWEYTYLSLATSDAGGTPLVMESEIRRQITFTGTNANVGLLWNVNGPMTVGAVFKTPFTARLRDKTVSYEASSLPELGIYQADTNRTNTTLTMSMPYSYGLGLQYRHSDAQTFAIDLYRTAWSRYSLTERRGATFNPVSGQPLQDGRLQDTTQVRLGAEHLLIRENDVIPLRCGVFYDPEPQTDSHDDYYGLSLGTGYTRDRVAFDLSYQYRFGAGVSSEMQQVNVDLKQHTMMGSMVYRF